MNTQKKTFTGKTLDIVLNQIELFYKENANIKKNKYSIGDEVFLKKGTFLHCLGNNNNNIDFILNNGFIACELSHQYDKCECKNPFDATLEQVCYGQVDYDYYRTMFSMSFKFMEENLF